jgi:hypothetical protein
MRGYYFLRCFVWLEGIINRNFARYYLAPKIRPSRIADANPCKMNICVHVVEKMSQPSLAV